MTSRTTSRLPQRGSPQWEEARRYAFGEHPSGLYCFKGTLGDGYPGYEDEQHIHDLAVLTANIIDQSISKTTYLDRPGLLLSNWRTYSKYCDHAGIPRNTRMYWPEVEICMREPERCAYEEATGKILLPLKCYYDQGKNYLNWMKLLPEAIHPHLHSLYNDYDPKTRLHLMKAHSRQYEHWRKEYKPNIQIEKASA